MDSTDSTEDASPSSEAEVICDYLIVGAGTACLSFVDTLVSLRKDFTFVIVDRNSSPGGHWTKAYPFVTLHQPSCYYGVRSQHLGRLDKNGKEVWDINDRATGKEVCDYYERVIKNLKATGRVQTYFGANYEGEATGTAAGDANSNSNNYNDASGKITHVITTKDGQSINIKCTKVVQSETNVVVPSMRKGVPFPIDESVLQTIPLNELPERIGNEKQKYMVIGAGKPGVDAINYLLEYAKVHPDQITWIISQSSWYLLLDGFTPDIKPGKQFWKCVSKAFLEPFIKAKSADELFLIMEEAGIMARVDRNNGDVPQNFRGASLRHFELEAIRTVKNVVKNKGRVTSITSNEVIFQNGAHSIPFSPSDTLVVDCMTTESYGYFSFEKDFNYFNPHKIRLGPLTAIYNPSHTSTQVAFLEAEFSDTAAGDAMKNSFCYFVSGRELEERTHKQLYLMSYYCEIKTNMEFSKYMPYSTFVLSDRTDALQANHHGGLLAVLWHAFGPTRLKYKTDTFVGKIENGGYEDFPTHPMPQKNGVDPKKIEAAKRTKTTTVSSKSMTKTNDKSNTGKKKKSSSAFCCRSANAIQANMHSFFL